MSDAGETLAHVLSGGWRSPVPALLTSVGDLSAVIPLLVGSGAGPLAWWRVRHSDLRDTPPAQTLRQAYRQTSIHNALRERDIEEACSLLRGASIEPILLKGWAIARLYPEPGLRPLGDIDLFIAPEDAHRAADALADQDHVQFNVDLIHDLPAVLKRGSWSDVFKRSRLAQLDDTQIRVLGPEDQLAYLCVHFLKHGGWRPLWLCDIAVALEARPPNFDWEVCLGTDSTRGDWIACAIGLAHALLGADVSRTPAEYRAHHLPRWLVPAVLKQWEHPCLSDHPVPNFITDSLRRPREWPSALRSRWLSPIEATVRVGGSFNEAPRLPYQAADYMLQLTRVVPRMLRLIRNG